VEPINFSLLPAIYFGSDYAEGFVTEHNRRELDVSYDEIGNTDRSAMGTMRGYVVARKRSWSVSWEEVPANQYATVDGFWSGQEMLDFYVNTLGSFTFKVYHNNNAFNLSNPLYTAEVRFKDFSYTVSKRNFALPSGAKTDLWNFDASWEEV